MDSESLKTGGTPAVDLHAASLRSAAEAQLREQSKSEGVLSIAAGEEVLHELQVHQIELEMQNEELRAAQERLEEARARYFDLYELAPTGYITVDAHGLITEANLAASLLLSAPRAILIRTALSKYILPEDQDRYYLHQKKLNESCEPQSFELRFNKGADKPPLWALMQLKSGADASGAPLTRIAATDITERKKLEQSLFQAQKLESVGRLAGGVAHDFNNLLMIISGYTEMVLATIKKEDSRYADLMGVYAAAQRAATLTRQLLAFSQKQLLQPKVLELNKVVSDCISMLKRLAGEDIKFALNLDAALWPVFVDIGQIEQIIMNLVVNAREAMPNGGVVTISTSNLDSDTHMTAQHTDLAQRDYVCLSFADTGIGMNKATQEKIFEPFFTTKDMSIGGGLGLSEVFGIVAQSGGSIEVSSEPGKGTAFSIYFPRFVETSHNTPCAVPIIDKPADEITILLVEDEESLRGLIERILTNAGYTVLSAADGVAAMALLAERAGALPDLVLTDVFTPNMRDSDLVKHLRKLSPSMKILFMSGYADAVVTAHGGLGAGSRVLGKPFDASTLTSMIRDVLASD